MISTTTTTTNISSSSGLDRSFFFQEKKKEAADLLWPSFFVHRPMSSFPFFRLAWHFQWRRDAGASFLLARKNKKTEKKRASFVIAATFSLSSPPSPSSHFLLHFLLLLLLLLVLALLLFVYFFFAFSFSPSVRFSIRRRIPRGQKRKKKEKQKKKRKPRKKIIRKLRPAFFGSMAQYFLFFFIFWIEFSSVRLGWIEFSWK